MRNVGKKETKAKKKKKKSWRENSNNVCRKKNTFSLASSWIVPDFLLAIVTERASERASQRIKRNTPFSLPPVWREKKNLFPGEKMISFLAQWNKRSFLFRSIWPFTRSSVPTLLSLLRSVVKRLFRGRVILGRGEIAASNVGEERGIRWRVYGKLSTVPVFSFFRLRFRRE